MFPISIKSLSYKERHDYILKNFILNKNNVAEHGKHKRDIDVIREHHRFLWDDEKAGEVEDSWEIRLAKRYYDKLFKEYCIADLSRYKENKVALRWRTEAEVVAGIGQFQCGSRKCLNMEYLRSWEVNFAYQEQSVRKNALVKLRLCPEHSEQLNYTSKKREVKRMKRQEAKEVNSNKRKFSNGRKRHSDGSMKEIAEQREESKDEEIAVTLAEDNKKDEIQDIWNKKTDIEVEPLSRETEFERYLEDLLL